MSQIFKSYQNLDNKRFGCVIRQPCSHGPKPNTDIKILEKALYQLLLVLYSLFDNYSS